MAVTEDLEVSDEEWDEFVHLSPGGNFEQSSAWGKLKGMYGWQPHRIVCRKGREIEGGAQLLVRRVGRVGKIGYLNRGPMTVDGRPESLERIVRRVDEYSRADRFAYLVVVPPFEGDNPEELLKSRGFLPKPGNFPPTGLVTADSVIDLSQTVERILGNMNRRTRRGIHRAGQAGARLRIGTGNDVGTFRTLMGDLCARRGVAPGPHQPDFFANAWSLLGERGLARLYFMELDGVLVSGAFVVISNGRFHFWKIGWSGDFQEHRPTHFLYWELIKLAKEEGFRRFEIGQILPDHARALQRGERPEGHYSGVTDFKMGFGGEIRVSPPVLFKSYLPFAQMALRGGALRLLSNRRILTLGKKLAKRIS